MCKILHFHVSPCPIQGKYAIQCHPWIWKLTLLVVLSEKQKQNSLSTNVPWNKSLNLIFRTKYVTPKSLKFKHWPSKKTRKHNHRAWESAEIQIENIGMFKEVWTCLKQTICPLYFCIVYKFHFEPLLTLFSHTPQKFNIAPQKW